MTTIARPKRHLPELNHSLDDCTGKEVRIKNFLSDAIGMSSVIARGVQWHRDAIRPRQSEEPSMYAVVRTLIRAFVDRAPKSWLITAGVVLASMSTPSFAKGCEEPSPDVSASCYLTGTYELRADAQTWLEIINPTGHELLV